MTDLVIRCWQVVWQSGWFSPGKTGGLFPFPERWQGWLVLGLFLAALVATIMLHGEAAVIVRVLLCVGYIAVGFATFE